MMTLKRWLRIRLRKERYLQQQQQEKKQYKPKHKVCEGDGRLGDITVDA